MTTSQSGAHLLMCRPEHFAVLYAINPWMDPKSWAREDRVLTAASTGQWSALHRELIALGATIEFVPSVPALPDLVFTANAAVVLNGTALLARFRHPQRQAEEPHFEAAFRALKARGVVHSITRLPDGIVLEGAGDCVFDASRNLFWMGYGPRSDRAARAVVEEVFGAHAVALELIDPRFYHMDTALLPLPRGEVMYVPGAFTPAGRTEIRARVARELRIEITAQDAKLFAANAVCLGDTVLLSRCGEKLRAELAERGYHVRPTPLDSFLRSGGSACCLTLALHRRSPSNRIEGATAAA
jgi:N-dimethylarginine dimethylaminohydrolase